VPSSFRTSPRRSSRRWWTTSTASSVSVRAEPFFAPATTLSASRLIARVSCLFAQCWAARTTPRPSRGSR
jgi:hypothetical protein